MTSKPVPGPRDRDPVVDAYRQHVDVGLLRDNLRLTPEQRVYRLQDALRTIEALRKARRKDG